MILLLDTSAPLCRLTLVSDTGEASYDWPADRSLARDLLAYLRDRLRENGAGWSDVTGIGVFQGPGSYTGLRIGLTVMNTLAEAEGLPIVGTTDEDWQQSALRRLRAGENDQIILPLYGGQANITAPRK